MDAVRDDEGSNEVEASARVASRVQDTCCTVCSPTSHTHQRNLSPSSAIPGESHPQPDRNASAARIATGLAPSLDEDKNKAVTSKWRSTLNNCKKCQGILALHRPGLDGGFNGARLCCGSGTKKSWRDTGSKQRSKAAA